MIRVFAALAVTVAAGMFVSPQARAASPAAWSAYEKEVAKACTEAAGLAKPKLWPQPAEFEKQSVTVVSGEIASGRMKGTRERMVCLFDKATRKASAAPAPEGVFR